MGTLAERVTAALAFQQRKHELPANYVETHVNRWTNMELLQAISDALQEEKDEGKDG